MKRKLIIIAGLVVVYIYLQDWSYKQYLQEWEDIMEIQRKIARILAGEKE